MVKQGKVDVRTVPSPIYRFKPVQSQGREVYSARGDDSSTESDEGEVAPHANMAVERSVPSKYEKSYEKTHANEKTLVFVNEKRDNRPPKSSSTKKAKEAREVMEKAREVLQDATIKSSSSQTRSLSPQDGSSGDLADDAADIEQQPQESEARRVMIKELVAYYRSELRMHCQELVTLQRQWKSELPVTVAVPVTIHPGAVAIVAATKPVRVNVRKSKGKESKGARGDIAVQRGPLKLPIRRRITWRANEREALRRGLLSFGLGRADKVRDVMSSLLKELRHGIGDIGDCCWEFLRCCGIHADAKEIVEYAQKRYAALKEMELESGPELTERVGIFEKTDKSSTLWLRRLRLLDSLQEVIRILSNKEQREVAYRAIDSVKDASVPAEWWSREADLALLYGIYKHGFGNYDLIRNDEEFRVAFTIKALKPKTTENDDTESEDDSERRIEISEAQWPDAQVLTRRLKRLVDHIIRSSQMPAKPPKGSGSARSGEDTPWSKRERLELIKLLMRWGAPMLPGGNGKLNWHFFREVTSSAPLRRRKDTSLDAGYQELMNDMSDYLNGPEATNRPLLKKRKKSPGKPAGEDNPAKASVLTYKTAVRLKERMEILDTLRLGVDSFRGDWASLGFMLYHDLPRWWTAGEHDHALALGVLKHGVGTWEAIFSDSSLGFEADVGGGMQGRGNDGGEMSDKEDSDDENSDEDNEPKVRPAPKPPGALLNIPSPTVCIKRLRYISNALRRAFKKPKPKRKRPTPEVKEVEGTRENVRPQKRPNPELREVEVARVPKRPKYVAPPPPPSPSPPLSPPATEHEDSEEMEYDIERDENGYPSLPLQLTETLTLVDLGVVDPDNQRFFPRDPHVYPIGYAAEREYASMVNPNDTTIYTCSIVEGGVHEGPIFQVTPADVPELYVEKSSAQGAWTVIFAAVNRVAKDPHRDRNPPSGVEMFGLNHPVVVQLIQEMVDAHARYEEEQQQQQHQQHHHHPRMVETSYRKEPVVEVEAPVPSRDRKKGKDKQPQSRSSRKKREEAPPRRSVPQRVELDLNSDPDDEYTD